MKRKNTGKCESFYAETINLIEDKRAKGLMTPEIVISLYLGSIARSLAAIADKMCEEDEHA